jgi:hypothetical protein
MKDLFRPTTEPARTLYDAFKKEAENRGAKAFVEWHNNEVRSVYFAACDYARARGRKPPTLQQVRDAEASARGHVDYGAKWAYRVAEVMQNPSGQSRA